MKNSYFFKKYSFIFVSIKFLIPESITSKSPLGGVEFEGMDRLDMKMDGWKDGWKEGKD